jgi:F420-dependent oxidoreductase-like protein
MKFGAWLSLSNPWQDVVVEARHVEASGWDGLWVADHFMPARQENDHQPVQEAWTVLSALAALTSRLRLGSLVSGNTYRNPGVLAKQVAQVDVVSGGRVVLGIGSGWQQNEHEAYDIPFYTVGGRLRRLEESVQVLRGLFDNERTTFEGRYYKFQNAPLAPKPVQPHLPILIGGGGEQVTLRIVAKYADEWNVWGSPETLRRKGAILDRYMEEAGRDPKSIKRSAQVILMISEDKAAIEKAKAATPMPITAGSAAELQELLGRYAEAGVDEFIVPNFSAGKAVEERREFFDRFIQDVAPALR